MRLIDADSLKKKIMGEPPEARYPSWYAMMVDEEPSVEPELKTAYWRTHIFDGIMGGRPRAYMCGYCNFISFARTNYCPNCGAKMEGKT